MLFDLESVFASALTRFPHDTVPDGAAFAPHHLYLGLLIMLLGVAAAWDDQRADPLFSGFGIGLTVFAFALVWPFYPAVGAILTLLGLASTGLGIVKERVLFRRKQLVLAVVGGIIAADDAVEHAFGVPTPLDIFFHKLLLPVINVVEQAV